MDQLEKEDRAGAALLEALYALREAKPEDRSEIARRYSITITELEKVIGYFHTFVVMAMYLPKE